MNRLAILKANNKNTIIKYVGKNCPCGNKAKVAYIPGNTYPTTIKWKK